MTTLGIAAQLATLVIAGIQIGMAHSAYSKTKEPRQLTIIWLSVAMIVLALFGLWLQFNFGLKAPPMFMKP